MNTNKNKIFAALLGIILAFAACQPEEFTMGTMISADQLQYSITQNADDPNMILLESLTPGVTPLWQTPMGRSTRMRDTVKIPFAGDYKFVYGVESDGGYIQADTFKLTLTTNNLLYVNDPLWTMLSGGVGNSKTWLLDLDENGVSKYFAGPLYFYGTDNGWLEGGDNGCYGSDCWNWNPDWAGNTWLMPQGDYGSMTFDLIGGAHISVDHLMLNREENGTYFLDASAKTLKMTDAGPLHDANRDGVVIDWGSLKVLSLTENTMQLAALRDAALSGEGACLLVYNFISKDYADNWVPADTPDPEPTLPDGWQDDISKVVNYEVKWVLSPETPFNWCNLDGSFMNSWNAVTDYPDWTGFSASVPATYENFSLTLNSDAMSAVFVAPDGTTQTGTYSLDEKGIYTFDGVKPAFNICSWVNLSTTAENQWRIMKIEKDAGGNVTGMWVGAKDPSKAEYMAFHLLPQFGGGSGSEEPQGTEIVFDNSKLVFGDLESNGNLRLELYNEYSSTKNNPPLDAASVVFENRMEITFSLSGISFNAGAAGSYTTAIGLADADWSAQYWGGGDGEVTVNGDGTYTIYCEPGSSFDTALVFVIDIKGMAADISDISAVSVTIDKVVIY